MFPERVKLIRCDALEGNSETHSEDLQGWVRAELVPSLPEGAGLVSLDGLPGVGKTTLAGVTGAVLKVPVIDLDDFIEEDTGRYLGVLKVGDLKAQILAALESHKSVLVSGCLVDRALEKCSLTADFRIFVARSRAYSPDDLGYPEEETILFRPEITAQIYIESHEAIGLVFNEFQRELIQYHKADRPIVTSDLIIVVRKLQEC